ncbi:MAG: AMP-binding protein [Phycisphaerales bacterium]|nr:AMP-binding protein [Phycisphaerales bacterium]
MTHNNSDNNLYKHLLKTAQPKAIAFELPDEQQILSYHQLNHVVDQYARVLLQFQLPEQSRILVQLEKNITTIYIYLAVIKLGYTLIPINPSYGHTEIQYFIEDAEPALFICTDAVAKQFNQIVKNYNGALYTPEQPVTLVVDNPINIETKSVDVDAIAVIIYTSGTTGKSKGAMLTHANFIAQLIDLKHAWKINEQDVLIHALPIFHVHGLALNLFLGLYSGATIKLFKRFDCDEVVPHFQKATIFMGVPTMYNRLINSPSFNRTAVGSIRLFLSGSAPLSIQTFETFYTCTGGYEILERYGMSETLITLANPYEGHRRIGTVGIPLPSININLIDPTGTPINFLAGQPSNIGELVCKGKTVMKGYWKKQDISFDENGWFKTGDLAMWDEKGYIKIVGRIKEMIISGGYKVYPQEVEHVILSFESHHIEEVAVFGVPDTDLGERVIAALVCNATEKPNFEDIKCFLKGKLAGYKIPKHFFWINELPKNAMGKVQRNVLYSSYCL